MGHDTHFLDRLSRVDRGQTELALELYRDPVLVKALLLELAPPEGAERIALALGEQAEGPHLIVARDGHFVTCLGEGMSVGPWPVISRAKLDAAVGRFERLRAARETVDEANARSRRGLGPLFARFYDSPFTLAREDMAVLVAVQPLLFDHYYRCLVDDFSLARKYLRHVERERVRGERRIQLLRGALTYYTIGGHHLVLLAGHGPAGFRGAPLPEQFVSGLLGELSDLPLLANLAVKVMWFYARMGKLLLPQAKAARLVQVRPSSLLLGTVGLGAMAAGHPGMRAEILKSLQRAHSVLTPEAHGENVARIPEGFAKGVRLILEDGVSKPSERLPELAERVCKLTGDSSNLDARMVAWLASRIFEIWDSDATLQQVVMTLADVPALSAEELYLSAHDHAKLTLEPNDGDCEYFFEASQKCLSAAQRRPVRAAPKPGRNDPCACGSGKKAKRCCA